MSSNPAWKPPWTTEWISQTQRMGTCFILNLTIEVRPFLCSMTPSFLCLPSEKKDQQIQSNNCCWGVYTQVCLWALRCRWHYLGSVLLKCLCLWFSGFSCPVSLYTVKRPLVFTSNSQFIVCCSLQLFVIILQCISATEEQPSVRAWITLSQLVFWNSESPCDHNWR